MKELIELSIIEDVVSQFIANEDMRDNFIKTLRIRQNNAAGNVISSLPPGNSASESDTFFEVSDNKDKPNIQYIATKGKGDTSNNLFLAPILDILLIPNKKGRLPEYKSKEAAAMDLYAAESLNILPGAIGIIGTGIKMAVPVGWKAEIYSRSGMATSGILVANAPGKIDSDYRGEVKVILYNSTQQTVSIGIGDRIAQMELNPVYKITIDLVHELPTTVRGEGGLGHTGK